MDMSQVHPKMPSHAQFEIGRGMSACASDHSGRRVCCRFIVHAVDLFVMMNEGLQRS